MRANELLTRTLQAAQDADVITWVVEQHPDTRVELQRQGLAAASATVSLRCDHTEVLVDVPRTHYRCCLTRHTLHEELAELARTAADSTDGQPEAVTRILSSAYQTQQPQRHQDPALQKRVLYPNRPPPFLRRAQHGGPHCTLCLQPSLVLQVEKAPSDSCVAAHYRDTAQQLVPLFVGIHVDEATQPFITLPTSHDDVHGCVHRIAHEGVVSLPSICLLPLEHVAVKEDGRTVVARYATVEYGLSTRPRVPTGKKRARAEDALSEVPTGAASTPNAGGDEAVTEVPLAFDWLLPALSARGNGWATMAETITKLESYKPQNNTVARYGLYADTGPVAQKRLDETAAARREKKVLRMRPVQLLDALLGVGERSPSAAQTKDTEEEEVLVVSGQAAATRVAVRGHPELSLHPLGRLHSSKAIPVEPCAMANAIALSTVLPPGVVIGRAADSHHDIHDVDTVTAVHSLMDLVTALRKCGPR